MIIVASKRRKQYDLKLSSTKNYVLIQIQRRQQWISKFKYEVDVKTDRRPSLMLLDCVKQSDYILCFVWRIKRFPQICDKRPTVVFGNNKFNDRCHCVKIVCLHTIYWTANTFWFKNKCWKYFLVGSVSIRRI